jgi:hypothetical protein
VYIRWEASPSFRGGGQTNSNVQSTALFAIVFKLTTHGVLTLLCALLAPARQLLWCTPASLKLLPLATANPQLTTHTHTAYSLARAHRQTFSVACNGVFMTVATVFEVFLVFGLVMFGLEITQKCEYNNGFNLSFSLSLSMLLLRGHSHSYFCVHTRAH